MINQVFCPILISSLWLGVIANADTELPVWIESNGLIVIEAEKGIPETNDFWSIQTDVDDYMGDGFIRWEGPDYLNNRFHGVMLYKIFVTHPGDYRLFLRSFHDPAVRGKRIDEENDCWTNYEIDSTYKFHKTYRNGSHAGMPWTYRTQWAPGEEKYPDALIYLPAGEHEFRLAARAAYFMIDRIFFVKGSSTVDVRLPESSINSTTYAEWLEQNFSEEIRNDSELEVSIWGLNADPDQDGVDNALEFYAAGDPYEKDDELISQTSADESTKNIRIRKAPRRSGMVLVSETSEDLLNWERSPHGILEIVTGDEIWEEASIPINGTTSEFLRFSTLMEESPDQ